MTDQLQLDGTMGSEPDYEPIFRPIQYLGSKARVLDQIEAAVHEVASASDPVCDLFSGSAVVTARLARSRSVVSVDIQEYSRVLANAMVGQKRLAEEAVETIVEQARRREREASAIARPLIEYEIESITQFQNGFPDDLSAVVEAGSVAAYAEGMPAATPSLARALQYVADAPGDSLPGGRVAPLFRYFGGVYFSYAQAWGLECVLAAIDTLDNADRELGLAAVVSAASELVGTVGSQFAQPLRPRDASGAVKVASLRELIRRRETDAIDCVARWLCRYRKLAPVTTGPHETIRADYRDFLASYQGPISAIYADPPYTRDHYSRFYHVLETIARGDDPGLARMRHAGETRVSRGLYRIQRHQSPFSIKSQAPGAFADLASLARQFEAPLLVSYSPYVVGSRPRLMTVPELVSVLERSFRDVCVHSLGDLTHSKLNAARLNGASPREAEVLISCTP